MFAGIGKPIFDCDTLSRYKKPPCGVFQTYGAHVWVSTLTQNTVPETIDSGPMCITDLFQNESLAYFSPKKILFKFFQFSVTFRGRSQTTFTR